MSLFQPQISHLLPFSSITSIFFAHFRAFLSTKSNLTQVSQAMNAPTKTLLREFTPAPPLVDSPPSLHLHYSPIPLPRQLPPLLTYFPSNLSTPFLLQLHPHSLLFKSPQGNPISLRMPSHWSIPCSNLLLNRINLYAAKSNDLHLKIKNNG